MQEPDEGPRWTTRAAAHAVTCPACGAEPGNLCKGAEGQPRKAAHQQRHQVALAEGAPVAEARKTAPRKAAPRRAAPRKASTARAKAPRKPRR